MTLSTQCARCRHFWGGGACDAFQQGIPIVIMLGDFDHQSAYPNERYPGDNGIRFEPVETNANPRPRPTAPQAE